MELNCDLAFFRKKFHVSQKDVASYCGVSVNTISSIERGEFLPRIELAIKLCQAFGIRDIRLLFSYDDRPVSLYGDPEILEFIKK